MMKYQLKPFGKGSDNLKTIEFSTRNATTYILGRNAATGLDRMCANVQHVSRNHVIITVRDGKIFMHPVARQDNLVYFNGALCERGEKEMKPEDTFSLLGSINHFNYKLVLIDSDDDLVEEEPTAKKPRISVDDGNSVLTERTKELLVVSLDNLDGNTGIPTKTKELSSSGVESGNVANVNTTIMIDPMHAFIKQLLRQHECMICYDTTACTYALSPCGDTFCFTCIEEWSRKHNNCPHCNQKFDIKTAIPSKAIDSSIRTILQQDKSMLEAWECRVGEGLAKVKEVLGSSTKTEAPVKNYRFMNPTHNPVHLNTAVFLSEVPQTLPTAVNRSNRTSSTIQNRRNTSQQQQQPPSIVDLT
jgi:hypothetical protein